MSNIIKASYIRMFRGFEGFKIIGNMLYYDWGLYFKDRADCRSSFVKSYDFIEKYYIKGKEQK